MALSNPSESPAVVVKEIDLTGGVPNVQSSTGAVVIKSRWGTVEERVLVANEEDLVDKFGAPDSATALSFMDANMFLKYSNKLQVVRAIDGTARNAVSTTGQTAADSAGSLPAEVVIEAVSVGRVLVVVSNLTNSYFEFTFTPPGFTTAPSLKILSPNLCI